MNFSLIHFLGKFPKVELTDRKNIALLNAKINRYRLSTNVYNCVLNPIFGSHSITLGRKPAVVPATAPIIKHTTTTTTKKE